MKICAGITILTLLLALPSTVRALGQETFGNAPAVNQPEWAKGILDVVNLESRVYSVWVNGNESFYYSGDAGALNKAIKKYAAVQSDVRRLILLPGTGKTQTFEGKPIAYDWQLHVPSGIYKAVAKKNDAELTVFINGMKPRPLKDVKQVEKWLKDLDDKAFRTRDKSQQELEKLGNDVKPMLREALKTELSPEARQRIETLLGKLRQVDVTDLDIPKGIEVVTIDDLLPDAWKGLKSADANISGIAIHELSRFTSYDAKIVPALIEMLKNDKNEYIRRVAASCLCNLDASAKAAVPVLKEGLDDPDANIRHMFKTALERIENAKDQPGQDERLKREQAIAKEIGEFKKEAANSEKQDKNAPKTAIPEKEPGAKQKTDPLSIYPRSDALDANIAWHRQVGANEVRISWFPGESTRVAKVGTADLSKSKVTTWREVFDWAQQASRTRDLSKTEVQAFRKAATSMPASTKPAPDLRNVILVSVLEEGKAKTYLYNRSDLPRDIIPLYEFAGGSAPADSPKK
jgi:hypothetical protein